MPSASTQRREHDCEGQGQEAANWVESTATDGVDPVTRGEWTVAGA